MQEIQQEGITLRRALYSPGYQADHWCIKGHIIQVLEGQLILDHQEGQSIHLETGMTYIVGDNGQPHKARTVNGARVLIID